MDKIKIPFSEFTFNFSRGSGPGGQNVNKVNSKVELTWDLEASASISQDIKNRFKEKFKNLITKDGLVFISSGTHRSQKMNQDECIEKLHYYLSLVQFPPKIRKKTKPKFSSVQKRLNSKKLDSLKKELRKKV